MKKKKLFFCHTIIILSLICFVNLIGCSKTEDLGDKYIHGKDSQYMFLNDIFASNIISSDTGYYVASDAYLYYIDKETGKSIIVCNKPNCLHDEEMDPEQKYKCNAFLNINSRTYESLNYYNDNLYAITNLDYAKSNQNKTNTLKLVKISKDGSKKQIMYEFENQILTATLHRGYLYFVSNNFEKKQIENTEVIVSNNSKLYRIPIDKKNAKAEIVLDSGLFEDGVSSLIAYGNNIYVIFYGYEDEKLDKSKVKIMRYNLITKNINEILNDKKDGEIGALSVYNGKLLYSYWYYDDNDERNTQLYTCDLDGNNSNPFIKLDFFGEKDCDDQFIYLDNIVQKISGQASERIIEIYNEYGTIIDSLNLGQNDPISNSWAILPGDNNFLFFIYKDNEKFNIKVVEKNDIGSDSMKLKDFFSVDLENLDNLIIY